MHSSDQGKTVFYCLVAGASLKVAHLRFHTSQV